MTDLIIALRKQWDVEWACMFLIVIILGTRRQSYLWGKKKKRKIEITNMLYMYIMKDQI